MSEFKYASMSYVSMYECMIECRVGENAVNMDYQFSQIANLVVFSVWLSTYISHEIYHKPSQGENHAFTFVELQELLGIFEKI